MDFDPKTENPIWVIYKGATDRAGPYTVRLRVVGKGGVTRVDSEAKDHPDLLEARAWVRAQAALCGLIPICLPRDPRDDAAIVECWL